MLLLTIVVTLSACEITIDPDTGQVILIKENGSKICIGQICKETFIFNAEAILQPVPPPGFIFDGWSLCPQVDNSACVLEYDAATVQKFWGQSFALNTRFRGRSASEIQGFYEGSTQFRGNSYTIGCLVDTLNAMQCFGSGATDDSKKISMNFLDLTPNGSGGFGEIRGNIIRNSGSGGDIAESVHLLNHNISPGLGMGVNYRADSDNADGSFSVAINANYNIGLALNLTAGDYTFVADENGPASGSFSIQPGGAIQMTQNGCTDTGTMSVTADRLNSSTYRVALNGNCATMPLGPSGVGTAVVLSTEQDPAEHLLFMEKIQGLPFTRPKHFSLKMKR
jgi:hypothetical protein